MGPDETEISVNKQDSLFVIVKRALHFIFLKFNIFVCVRAP